MTCSLFLGLIHRRTDIFQLGIKPQEARMLLPGALKTELFMTGTKNDWEKFLLLRNSSAAHPMIRYLAEKIDKILNNEAAQ